MDINSTLADPSAVSVANVVFLTEASKYDNYFRPINDFCVLWSQRNSEYTRTTTLSIELFERILLAYLDAGVTVYARGKGCNTA